MFNQGEYVLGLPQGLLFYNVIKCYYLSLNTSLYIKFDKKLILVILL